jgi:UDP-glucuronate 4-epimerase
MRYVVTGVGGFIGSHLAEALVSFGEDVVGVDCFTPYYPREAKESNLATLRDHGRFELVEADLRVDDLSRVLEAADVVFHLAGQPGVRASWGTQFDDYLSHNVTSTHRLLEACVAARVGRLVYSSSSSVYGNSPDLPTTEASATRPFSPYGVTKLAAEHLCGVYAANHDLPTVSLRYFTVFGPRQRPDMAFHRFIEAALHGRPIKVYGTGEQRRSFTYVGDVVQANLLAAVRPVPTGSVINIAGGAQASVNEVLTQLGELLRRSPEVRRRPAVAGDVGETRADCALAELVLGFEPSVGLTKGLEMQLAWHLGETAAAPARPVTYGRSGPGR